MTNDPNTKRLTYIDEVTSRPDIGEVTPRPSRFSTSTSIPAPRGWLGLSMRPEKTMQLERVKNDERSQHQTSDLHRRGHKQTGHRRGHTQTVEVQHVHLHSGAQGVVGIVNAAGEDHATREGQK